MIGDRLIGRPAVFEAAREGSTPSPRTLVAVVLSKIKRIPGQLLLVATPGSDPGGRWFDSNPRSFVAFRFVAFRSAKGRGLLCKAIRVSQRARPFAERKATKTRD